MPKQPPLIAHITISNEQEVRAWAEEELRKEGETDFKDLKIRVNPAFRSISIIILLREWEIIAHPRFKCNHDFFFNGELHRTAGPANVSSDEHHYFIHGEPPIFPLPMKHCFARRDSKNHSPSVERKLYKFNNCHFWISFSRDGVLSDFHIVDGWLDTNQERVIFEFLQTEYKASLADLLLLPSNDLRKLAERQMSTRLQEVR